MCAPCVLSLCAVILYSEESGTSWRCACARCLRRARASRAAGHSRHPSKTQDGYKTLSRVCYSLYRELGATSIDMNELTDIECTHVLGNFCRVLDLPLAGDATERKTAIANFMEALSPLSEERGRYVRE